MPNLPSGVNYANRFAESLQFVLSDKISRRILLALYKANRAVRHEELLRALGDPDKEEFRKSLMRLTQHLLVVKISGLENGNPTLTTDGKMMAEILMNSAEVARKTDGVPPRAREAAAKVILGEL